MEPRSAIVIGGGLAGLAAAGLLAWLWRVGASVHPGEGVPAVLSGAMISTGRLLEKLGS